MKKKKLIFVETLLKNGGGHHMDNLIFKSFEKANTDMEYAHSVLRIIDNYEFYLKECKKF